MITANFGVAPRSYRSGRWGFSDAVAVNLIRLGYHVDTSIAPLTDWSAAGGPDYSTSSSDPFTYAWHDGATAGSLLEVPATIDFVQHRRNLASGLYWFINRRLPFPSKVLAVLARLNVLNHVWLSPETNTDAQMKCLLVAAAERGSQVVNMFFHSPSLLEGCSPFVRTPAQLDDFMARIEHVLEFASAAGMQFVTMAELGASVVTSSRELRLSTLPRNLESAVTGS